MSVHPLESPRGDEGVKIHPGLTFGDSESQEWYPGGCNGAVRRCRHLDVRWGRRSSPGPSLM